jgi:hypothetical protein
LSNQASASGAKRDANGELFLTSRQPRELQAREIRADDQHHDRNGAREHEQRGSKSSVDPFVERDDLRSKRVSPAMLATMMAARRALARRQLSMAVATWALMRRLA